MALTKIKSQVLDVLSPALGVSSGGTGLSSPGASGNVLTSNGLEFISSPPAPALGVGQTWQNVLSTRVAATTYTNNTGKPIQVLICANPTTAANTLVVTVNGVQIYATGSSTWDNSAQASFIVPNGSTYSVTTSSSFRSWAELR